MTKLEEGEKMETEVDSAKIYIVLWNDRHTDVTATPFPDLGQAKKWAKEQALEYCRSPEDLEEKKIEGWKYYVRYSCEGDCLWITEHNLIIGIA